MNCLPGNAAQARLGITGTPAEQQALATKIGINRPLPGRYVHWLGQVLRGRLGSSLASGETSDLLDRAVMVVGVTAISIAPFVPCIGLVMVFAVSSAGFPPSGSFQSTRACSATSAH